MRRNSKNWDWIKVINISKYNIIHSILHDHYISILCRCSFDWYFMFVLFILLNWYQLRWLKRRHYLFQLANNRLLFVFNCTNRISWVKSGRAHNLELNQPSSKLTELFWVLFITYEYVKLTIFQWLKKLMSNNYRQIPTLLFSYDFVVFILIETNNEMTGWLPKVYSWLHVSIHLYSFWHYHYINYPSFQVTNTFW